MNKSSVITNVYKSMFKNIFYFLLSVFAVLAAGIIIVFPVWFFSVNYPAVYSLIIVLLMLLFIIYSVFSKINKKELSLNSIFRSLIKVLYYIILLSGTGTAAVLFINALYLQGTAVLIVLFIGSGAVIHLKNSMGND